MFHKKSTNLDDQLMKTVDVSYKMRIYPKTRRPHVKNYKLNFQTNNNNFGSVALNLKKTVFFRQSRKKRKKKANKKQKKSDVPFKLLVFAKHAGCLAQNQ